MKIHDRIYVVGGGDASFGLSNELDCTVYLLDGGDESALIDSGCGIESERIIKNVENVVKSGFPVGNVGKIMLTHAHADHCGGAAKLAAYYGAKVYAGALAADFLARADMESMSVAAGIECGLYPPDYTVEPCRVIPTHDNEKIKIGDLQLQVIDAPGHSDGHVGYYLEYEGKRLLFSGDLAFGKAKISLQKTWDCRLQAYLESLRRVERMKIDALLTGHQAFCMDGAHRIFERILSAGLAAPDSL